jgi:hypothetical protein
MNRTLASGVALTALGTAGYVLGVAGEDAVGLVDPYPGRAFSVTGVMVGITLLSVGLSYRGDRR